MHKTLSSTWNCKFSTNLLLNLPHWVLNKTRKTLNKQPNSVLLKQCCRMLIFVMNCMNTINWNIKKQHYLNTDDTLATDLGSNKLDKSERKSSDTEAVRYNRLIVVRCQLIQWPSHLEGLDLLKCQPWKTPVTQTWPCFGVSRSDFPEIVSNPTI